MSINKVSRVKYWGGALGPLAPLVPTPMLIMVKWGSLTLQRLTVLFTASHNSLQFFQWLVNLQCPGQSYGSSVSKVIGSEATVDYDQTWTNLTVNDHHQRGQRGQRYQYMGFKGKIRLLRPYDPKLNSHQTLTHKHHSMAAGQLALLSP